MTTELTVQNQNRPKQLMIVAVFVTVLLYVLPYTYWIKYPLLLLSTYVHEMGHGLTAILVGGQFAKLSMHADASGVATFALPVGASVSKALVAMGGLCGPAIVAGIGFALSRKQRATTIGLGLAGLIATICLVLYVRTLVGVLISLGLIAVCFGVLALKKPAVSQGVLLFLSVQLALAVFSRSDYLFMKEAHTTEGVMPSDVQQIANSLVLPYWFWGAVCAAISVAALLFGVWMLWRSPKSKEESIS